ncbi:MAG: TIGR04100 family radical SAM protein [Oscillospiraceae bacterium]|nr:TIGR04100 family radical SAM protein [Oscillospiraceae bacterium]
MNVYAYKLKTKLYFNITNRCPANCVFCLRRAADGVNEGESLWLEREPDFGDIKKAVDGYNLEDFDEAVFCGYGEPTERLDLLLAVAEYIKSKRDIPLRLNTNGLSDLINGKKTAPLLCKNIDSASISLNAPNKEEYQKLCRTAYGEAAFGAMLDFAKECKTLIKNVNFTAVDVLSPASLSACRKISEETGIPLFIRAKV